MDDPTLTFVPIEHNPFETDDPYKNLLNYKNQLDQQVAYPPSQIQDIRDPTAGSLKPYNSSWGERLGAAAQDAMSWAGASKGYSQQFGQNTQDIARLAPITGNVIGANEAYRDYQAGNYLGAAINAAGSTPIPQAIFAGPLAKTADLEALNLAKQMESAGHPKLGIYNQTGWFKGTDNQWRYEIPDTNLQWSDPFKATAADIDPHLNETISGKLGNFITHPELFQAYPQLQNTDLELDVGPYLSMGGGYTGPAKISSGKISSPLIEAYGSKHYLEDPSREGGISTLAHELQHGVQNIEGFTPGANPNYFGRFASDPLLQEELYKRTAGEVEARNVETRRIQAQTVGQENLASPWVTQQYPPNKQVVLPLDFNPKNVQFPPEFKELKEEYNAAHSMPPNIPKGAQLIPIDHDPFSQLQSTPTAANIKTPKFSLHTVDVDPFAQIPKKQLSQKGPSLTMPPEDIQKSTVKPSNENVEPGKELTPFIDDNMNNILPQHIQDQLQDNNLRKYFEPSSEAKENGMQHYFHFTTNDGVPLTIAQDDLGDHYFNWGNHLTHDEVTSATKNILQSPEEMQKQAEDIAAKIKRSQIHEIPKENPHQTVLNSYGPEWQKAPVIDNNGKLLHNNFDPTNQNNLVLRKNEDGTYDKGISAYHASPHDFDKFDSTKIDTGQGAQSYGHGLYFAQEPKVANAYLNTLGKNPQFEYNLQGSKERITSSAYDPKRVIEHVGLTGSDGYPAQWALQKMYSDGLDLPSAINDMKENYSHFDPDIIAKNEKVLNDINPKVSTKGKSYHTFINANPEHFLDWDVNRKNQSQHVQDSLRTFLEQKEPKRRISSSVFIDHPPSMTGNRIYHDLQDKYVHNGQNNDDLLVKDLHNAGIQGIKYNDQFSRNIRSEPQMHEGLKYLISSFGSEEKAKNYLNDMIKNPEGLTDEDIMNVRDQLKDFDKYHRLHDEWQSQSKPTKNYVVFNDKNIQILKKFGLAGLGIAGAGAIANKNEAQAKEPDEQENKELEDQLKSLEDDLNTEPPRTYWPSNGIRGRGSMMTENVKKN